MKCKELHDECRCSEIEHQDFLKKFGDFNDFKVDAKVKIISSCVDFRFFRKGQTGTVIRNSGKYLGIRIKFDKPMEYEDGHILNAWGFNPTDLELLK